MVLHTGDQDLIAFLQEQLPKTVRRQVDARRSATGEDDLVRVLRVDVLADRLASGLLRFGGLGA